MEFAAAMASLVLLQILIVIDLGFTRSSWKLARSLDLPKGQRLQPVKTLAFTPVMALLAVGILIGAEISRSWEHLLVGVAGAALGVWVGHLRCRRQYVRADPEHRSVVSVRDLTEYRVLIVLIPIGAAANLEQVRRTGPLALLITFLLVAAVFESIGRAWFFYRRYAADTASTSAPARPVR